MANVLVGISIDAERRIPRLGNITGGLVGPAMKPVMLRYVYECAKVVKIPIIGAGGIVTGEDAVEFLLAGATAVQLGTANFLNPTAMIDAIEWIRDYCARHGIGDIAELVGGLRDRPIASTVAAAA